MGERKSASEVRFNIRGKTYDIFKFVVPDHAKVGIPGIETQDAQIAFNRKFQHYWAMHCDRRGTFSSEIDIAYGYYAMRVTYLDAEIEVLFRLVKNDEQSEFRYYDAIAFMLVAVI